MKVSVWQWRAALCSCVVFHLIFTLKFPTHLCKLPQCLAVSGHDPAVRMQLRLILQPVCLSVRLHACANTRRGRILFTAAQCSHSAGWRELCPVIDTPPHTQQVCEGSPGGLQHRLTSQVTEAAWQELVEMSSHVWATRELCADQEKKGSWIFVLH